MRLLYRMFSTRSKGCNHIYWLHSTWSVLLVWQSSLLPATIGGPSDEPDVCLASDTLQARLNRHMANQFSSLKKGYLPHWLGRWYGKNVKLSQEWIWVGEMCQQMVIPHIAQDPPLPRHAPGYAPLEDHLHPWSWQVPLQTGICPKES